MPKVEVNVPDYIDMGIAQLVDQDEFMSREEAVEELLSSGLKAYKTSGPSDDDGMDGGMETEGMMGHDDEYVF